MSTVSLIATFCDGHHIAMRGTSVRLTSGSPSPRPPPAPRAIPVSPGPSPRAGAPSFSIERRGTAQPPRLAAVAEFNLTAEQRKRLVMQERG